MLSSGLVKGQVSDDYSWLFLFKYSATLSVHHLKFPCHVVFIQILLDIWSCHLHIWCALSLGGAHSCKNKPQVVKVWKSSIFANIMRQWLSLLKGKKLGKNKNLLSIWPIMLYNFYLLHHFDWQQRHLSPINFQQCFDALLSNCLNIFIIIELYSSICYIWECKSWAIGCKNIIFLWICI